MASKRRAITIELPRINVVVGQVTNKAAYILIDSDGPVNMIVTVHGDYAPYTTTPSPSPSPSSVSGTGTSTSMSIATTTTVANIDSAWEDPNPDVPPSRPPPILEDASCTGDIISPSGGEGTISGTTSDGITSVSYTIDDEFESSGGNLSRCSSSSYDPERHSISVEELALTEYNHRQFNRTINAGPNILPIYDLQPNSFYTVAFDIFMLHGKTQVFDETTRVSFHTRGDGYEVKKLIVASCDYADLDVRESLWLRVAEEHPDIVVHLGDNVYGDDIFRAMSRKGKGLQISAVYEAYNNLYLDTFARWAPHLLGASHYFVMDDHDIVNGAACGTYRPGTTQNRIASVARDVYERHNPIETSHVPALGRDCYVSDGYIAEDSMGVTWTKLDAHTMMITVPRYYSNGKPLFSGFFKTLQEVMLREGEYNRDTVSTSMTSSANGEVVFESDDHHPNKITKLLICFSTAPIPRPSGISAAAYKTVYGTDGLWTNSDVEILYDRLFVLLASRQGSLKIILVGGDLHIGVDATVTKGEYSFQVCVSSPISNQPTDGEKLLATGIRKVTHIGDFGFAITACDDRRNYLSIDMQEFKGTLVFSPYRYPAKKIHAVLSVVGMI